MSEQPVEQPANGPADPLTALDYILECCMVHDGVQCHRPATHSARVHLCKDRTEGVKNTPENLVLVCDHMITTVVGGTYPSRCTGCKHAFGNFLDVLWDIKPLTLGGPL